MGRGRSKLAGGGAGGAGGAAGELQLPDGTKAEFEGTLKFGQKDAALTGDARTRIESWENKRVKNKVEYAFAVDKDGNAIGKEIRGSKNSVSVPRRYHDAEDGTFTHIHPRDQEGYLGGTFSGADLNNFANFKQKTVRAAAKEGTYSMSKGANFDASGFKRYAADAEATFHSNMRKKGRALNQNFSNMTYDEYAKAYAKTFNTELVNLHNTYLAGQRQYGYTYTLEKR